MVAPPRIGQRSAPVPTGQANFKRDEEEPGFFERAADSAGAIGTGAALGFLDDPLVAAALGIAKEHIPGFDGPDLNAMRDVIAGRPVAKSVKFLTGIATLFGTFTPAAIAGRGVILAGLKAGAKRAVAAGAVKKTGQLANIANRAKDIGGNVSKTNPNLIQAPMNALERAGIILGHGVGVSGIVGATAIMEGKDASEVGREAAMAFAMSATFETALIPVGRFFSARMRAHSVDQNTHKAEFAKSQGLQISPQARADKTTNFFKDTARDQIKVMYQLLNVDRQVQVLKPGLSDAQASVMTALQKTNGQMTVGELAGSLGKTTLNVGNTVRSLTKKRFLKGTRDLQDAQLNKFNAKLKAQGVLPARIEEKILQNQPQVRTGTERLKTQPKAFEKGIEVVRRQPKDLPKTLMREYEELRQSLRLTGSNIRTADLFARNPAVIKRSRDIDFSHGKARQLYLNSVFKMFGSFDNLVDEFGEAAARVMSGAKFADDTATIKMALNKSLIAPLERRFLKAVGIRTAFTKRSNAKRQDILEEAGHQYEIDPDTVNLSGLKQWADDAGYSGDEIVDIFKDLRNFISGDLGYNGILRSGGMPPVDLSGKYGTPKNYLTHLSKTRSLDSVDDKLLDVFRGNPSIRAKIEFGMRQDPLDEAEILTIAKKLELNPDDISIIDDMWNKVDPEVLNRATTAGYHNGPPISIQTRMSDFGAFDFNRTIKATAKQMREMGFNIERNPFESSLRYLNAAARRIEMGKVLGPRGEVFDQAMLAAQAEGKNMELAKGLMERFLNNPHDQAALRDVTLMMTAGNIATKMVISVFANLTQPQNLLYAYGLRSTARGFREVMNTGTRKELEAGMALSYSMLDDMGHVMAEDGLAKGAFRMMAEWVLKYTGFEKVERWNRVWSGGTGIAVAKDIIIRGGHGKIRGLALDRARLNALDLGFNLDDVINQTRHFRKNGTIDKEATSRALAEWFEVGGINPLSGSGAVDEAGKLIVATRGGKDLLAKAAFLAAQKTQFIPSAARRPEFWNHPMGRLMFQFKTFALHQFKFLKDAVVGEAAAGNPVPLAYFMSVSPIAGEFVGDMRAFALDRERPDNPQWRTIDNMLAAGAFGLAADVFQSALHGDLKGALMGPTVDTAFGVVEGTVNAIFKQDPTDLKREMATLPAIRVSHRIFNAVKFDPEMITDYLTEFSDPVLGIQSRANLAAEQKRAREQRRLNLLRRSR